MSEYNNLQNANLVRPRLWLGNYAAARDERFIQANNINVVFNCTKDLDFLPTPSVQRRYRIPVDDNLRDEEIINMEKWAPETIMILLQEYKNGNTILVHCAAGMQRSAAVVAMLLIVLEGLTPEQAIAAVQEKRAIAFRPSANFRRSIEGFWQYYRRRVIPSLDAAKKNN
jgi:dual specificity phosphatase 12